MYAYITGRLTFKSATHVIVEAGGIGYYINISLHTFSQIGKEENCKLHTFMHVKEDAHTLYGFAEEGEKKLFMHLISISGIGPNTARMILSSSTPSEVQSAIMEGNIALMQSIKGIGAKTAQRIILELQDKLKKEGYESLIREPHYSSVKDEAIGALVMLGFSKNVVEKNLSNVMKNMDGEPSVEQLIKATLKNL